MASQLDEIQEMVKEIRTAIYGNGKDGLLTRMKVIEQAQAGDTWRWRALYGLVGALTVGILGRSIYDLIKHLS